jgi:hypothetical protein
MNFFLRRKGTRRKGYESFFYPLIANSVKDGRDSSEKKSYLDTEKEAAGVERPTVLK